MNLLEAKVNAVKELINVQRSNETAIGKYFIIAAIIIGVLWILPDIFNYKRKPIKIEDDNKAPEAPQ